MNIEPMPRDQFLTALNLLTGGSLADSTDQAVANWMVVSAFIHAIAFEEAARRGWCGVSDTGKPVATYPAWPEEIAKPEIVTAEDSAHA